jgi:hypothetical protein
MWVQNKIIESDGTEADFELYCSLDETVNLLSTWLGLVELLENFLSTLKKSQIFGVLTGV